jgi:uncharacterized protein (TIGR04255 family)
LISGDEVIGNLAKIVRHKYPILEESPEPAFTITQDGIKQTPGDGRIWRLRSPDEKWQVSIGDTFIALDTSSYTSRDDLCNRLEEILTLFDELVDLPFVERIGIRYLNRVSDPDFIEHIEKYVRLEVRGGLATPLTNGVRLQHSLCDSLYSLDDLHSLQVRWGILPPRMVIDTSVPPVDTPSWTLDLDSSFTQKHEFDSNKVVAVTKDLADQAYRYFRWSITPDFLRRFGGSV